MRILLDTNILLRLLNPADSEYAFVRSAVDTSSPEAMNPAL